MTGSATSGARFPRKNLPMVARLAVFAFVALSSTLALPAQETPAQPEAAPKEQTSPPPQDPEQEAQDPPDLTFETGKVNVPGLATIDLPPGWRYLQALGARRVLEKHWGNMRDPSTLGLAFPPGSSVHKSVFAVVVSFDEAGHINDDDAGGLDYAQLLKDMQEGARAENEQRKRAGVSTVELLGWAEPPHYDAQEKKLYWAKKLLFDGNPNPTLNYDVRILGRRGSLVLTALGEASDLEQVAAGCKQMLRATEFVDGQRYADFNPSLDKVAAYGIGGLIAGKLLLKAGFLKLLIGFWKPLAIGVVLILGAIAKLFGRRRAAAAGGDAGGSAS
jgi:uncharacterized membrane-anchored protein